MQCFVHAGAGAAGVCAGCGRGMCRECVAVEAPRLVCRACVSKPLYGFEYRSAARLGSLPLVRYFPGSLTRGCR